MSMRLFTVRLAKHGRCFLRSYWNRDIHTNILEQTNLKALNRRNPSATSSNVGRLRHPELLRNGVKSTVTQSINSGIYRVGQHARKLFIDNILNRVTTNYSEQLRQQATKKLFYGDSAPFFALIGVSLASGSGVLTKEDELEGVCWEIRQAAERLQTLWNKDDLSNNISSNLNVDDLDVGPPIAKGCAAVVYAVALKDSNAKHGDVGLPNYETRNEIQQPTIHQLSADRLKYMSPIKNMSHFVHNNFGDNVNNSPVAFIAGELAYLQQNREASKSTEHESADKSEPTTSHAGHIQEIKPLGPVSTASLNRYPLALKMMFNYDIQSNALSILRAMYKETVPARQRLMSDSTDEWQRLVQHQTLSLPPHPNIVCMFGFFCDEVRNFPDGSLLYPIAQPQRINPLGYGRNMSLYLLMKRYDLNLRNLLDLHSLVTRTRLLLFTQLLEAITHINRHGIAHRDLKSDNILIELNEEDSSPVLVLSDFGCCLADKVHGLQVPYNSYDVDKGGNTALMAPEIINKQPGPFTVLNYEKSDLWACGAIAYEIFGLQNPFYSSSNGLAHAKGELTYSLRNNDYKEEDLLPLSDSCPPLVQQLIYNILNPNPSKRLSPDVAANVMQLFLWAPSNWLKVGGAPNSSEILQWLLTLTTKVMCEGRPRIAVGSETYRCDQYGRNTYVEYLLICSFLARARLHRIRRAINWIQSVVA